MGAVGFRRAATGGMVRQNLEGVHDLLEGRRGDGFVAAHGNRGGKTQQRLPCLAHGRALASCMPANHHGGTTLRSIATGACKHMSKSGPGRQGSQKLGSPAEFAPGASFEKISLTYVITFCNSIFSSTSPSSRNQQTHSLAESDCCCCGGCVLAGCLLLFYQHFGDGDRRLESRR